MRKKKVAPPEVFLACLCEQKEWIEFLAYPCNDSICVCNLSTSDPDRSTREKRLNHEVLAHLIVVGVDRHQLCISHVYFISRALLSKCLQQRMDEFGASP